MRKLIAVAAFAAAAALASAANAVVVPFGGAATGTDPLGGTWEASNSFKPSWGEPGLGLGTLSFNPGSFSNSKGPWATEFSFIFLKGVDGSIDTTPAAGPGGWELTTRFSDTTKDVLWTAHFVSPQEVDFFAPVGSRIDPGDHFFVNVAFTGPVNTDRFSFAGLWSDQAGGVPEPASWALMIGGFGLAGAALRTRREQSAAA